MQHLSYLQADIAIDSQGEVLKKALASNEKELVFLTDDIYGRDVIIGFRASSHK